MTHANSPQAYHVHSKREKPWHDGWQLYLLLCFSLSALYALPAEYKGIGAAGIWLLSRLLLRLDEGGRDE